MEPLTLADDDDDLPEANDFDPTEVFTMEDFVVEYEIVEELWFSKNVEKQHNDNIEMIFTIDHSYIQILNDL
jgi:hypothetical protein